MYYKKPLTKLQHVGKKHRNTRNFNQKLEVSLEDEFYIGKSNLFGSYKRMGTRNYLEGQMHI